MFLSDYLRNLSTNGTGRILSFGKPLKIFFFHYIIIWLKMHRKCLSAIELQLVLNRFILQLHAPWICHYKFHTIPFPYEVI